MNGWSGKFKFESPSTSAGHVSSMWVDVVGLTGGMVQEGASSGFEGAISISGMGSMVGMKA